MIRSIRMAEMRAVRRGSRKVAKSSGNGSKAPGKRRNGTRVARVKISKTLAWVEKYLRRVERLMPATTMPRAIRSFVPNPRKKHRTLGNCCLDDRTITLATHSIKLRTMKDGKKKRELIPLSHLEILQTLAHEMSHLAYEEHGYEQEWYGRTIFHTFGIREACPHCHGKGRMPARYENT
jgi:hypothetical protein